MEPFNENRSVVHVLRGSFGIALLNRYLPWPYGCLYINSFHRDDSLKFGSTESEVWKKEVYGGIKIYVCKQKFSCNADLLAAVVLCQCVCVHEQVPFYDRKLCKATELSVRKVR